MPCHLVTVGGVRGLLPPAPLISTDRETIRLSDRKQTETDRKTVFFFRQLPSSAGSGGGGEFAMGGAYPVSLPVLPDLVHDTPPPLLPPVDDPFAASLQRVSPSSFSDVRMAAGGDWRPRPPHLCSPTAPSRSGARRLRLLCTRSVTTQSRRSVSVALGAQLKKHLPPCRSVRLSVCRTKTPTAFFQPEVLVLAT